MNKVLHTIVPLEVVFSNKYDGLPKQQLVKVDGVEMLVEPLGFGEAKVVRVLSSNPAHYLNTKFQPGSNLKIIN